jgi:hypothetical protein
MGLNFVRRSLAVAVLLAVERFQAATARERNISRSFMEELVIQTHVVWQQKRSTVRKLQSVTALV